MASQPPSTSSLDLPSLATRLKSLHHNPTTPLILTNVHDAGTATLIASLPATAALATASYSIAATQGVPDAALTLAGNLAGIATVARGLRNAGRANEIPLSADLQDGYEDVGETVRKAIELGVVGANIEDVDNGVDPPRLRGVEEQVGRIREAVRAARGVGVLDFVVNARTDVLGFEGGGGVEEVVERGKRYLDAGAECVFVWGVGKHDITEAEAAEMVSRLGGRVSLQPGVIGVAGARRAGACRVSVGPMLYRKALEVVEREAVGLLEA